MVSELPPITAHAPRPALNTSCVVGAVVLVRVFKRRTNTQQ